MEKNESQAVDGAGGVRVDRLVRPGRDRRLKAAYAKLMKMLNDEDQEGCLYMPTLDARDAVNKILNEEA